MKLWILRGHFSDKKQPHIFIRIWDAAYLRGDQCCCSHSNRISFSECCLLHGFSHCCYL